VKTISKYSEYFECFHLLLMFLEIEIVDFCR
jgi:hypothetical protein